MYSPGRPYIVVAPVVTSWAVAGQRMVFFHMFLQARVTLEAFPIVSPRGRSSKFPWRGTNCGKTLNSMYYATCRQRVCGQNKDNVCLHAARTLIWRSCAFNRGPMTMPILDGPMTMPVLDGVKPMAITLPICGTSVALFWKRKKSIYCWTRSRPTWTFGESDDQVRDKSESKYQRVQDKSETIEKRLETGLEYYSPM